MGVRLCLSGRFRLAGSAELTVTGAADVQGVGTVSLVVVSPPEDLPQVGVFELPFLAGPASAGRRSSVPASGVRAQITRIWAPQSAKTDGRNLHQIGGSGASGTPDQRDRA